MTPAASLLTNGSCMTRSNQNNAAQYAVNYKAQYHPVYQSCNLNLECLGSRGVF